MIEYGNTHWSLGVLVTLPLMVLLIASCLGFAIWAHVREWDDWDRALSLGCQICGFALAILLLIGTALGMYPYKAQYHQWQDISGTVTSTNSRFLASQDGTDQKFVVTFQGSDQQFGCSDTRCSTIRKGDYLVLSCKRSFQLFSTPGYDCRFRDYKKG